MKAGAHQHHKQFRGDWKFRFKVHVFFSADLYVFAYLCVNVSMNSKKYRLFYKFFVRFHTCLCALFSCWFNKIVRNMLRWISNLNRPNILFVLLLRKREKNSRCSNIKRSEWKIGQTVCILFSVWFFSENVSNSKNNVFFMI